MDTRLTDDEAVRILDRNEIAPIGTRCPPHNFAAAWANKADTTDDDTVSVMFCTLCGDVRALRLRE